MNALYILEEQIPFGIRQLIISAPSKVDAIKIAQAKGYFQGMKSNKAGIARVLEMLNSVHIITLFDIERGGLLNTLEFSE